MSKSLFKSKEKMKNFIKKLIFEIQEDGWDVVNKKKQQILNFDNKQFIIEILNTESFRNTFAEATLLILPELWKDFNLSDWLEIMRRIKSPVNYRVLMDDGPYFVDIRFLCSWIGIDARKLFREDKELPEQKRRH